MAYNFPVGYQSYYQPYQVPQQASPSVGSSIIWVQGEAGAKSYLVAPNSTVQLWDSERQVIYLKSADASGMPSMKILDYTIRESQQIPPQSTEQPREYVTRSELDEFEARMNARFEKLSATGQRRKEKQGDESAIRVDGKE